MGKMALFFLINVLAFAGPRVTSQEQFKRFLQDRSPASLTYNFERAYVEVQPNENCPPKATAFFSLHINKAGEVDAVKGHLVAFSSDLRSITLGWANALLKQMHFRPLMYGAKPSTVDTNLTLVCAE